MIAKRLPVMVLAMCCIGQAASAGDEPGYTSRYSACMEKAGGITSDTLNCMGAENKIQDASLNKAYKALMATLSPARKKTLQEAQRAWIKFRDANCNYYEDPEGGTMASMMGSDCLLFTTATRARELERFKEW